MKKSILALITLAAIGSTSVMATETLHSAKENLMWHGTVPMVTAGQDGWKIVAVGNNLTSGELEFSNDNGNIKFIGSDHIKIKVVNPDNANELKKDFSLKIESRTLRINGEDDFTTELDDYVLMLDDEAAPTLAETKNYSDLTDDYALSFHVAPVDVTKDLKDYLDEKDQVSYIANISVSGMDL